MTRESFTIKLREELLTKSKSELLIIAKDALWRKQKIQLFWTGTPGEIILYHPYLNFGMAAQIKKVLDVNPVLLMDDWTTQD